jgi:hypothetical protein
LYDGRFLPTTVENPRYNYKAYSSAFTDAWETDANIKYLRYAEVVLMKAEALNELDQTGPAIILLNDIRRRAQLLPTTALSKAHRTAIYKERRVELAFEHDRFYDLVRTGQLLQHLRFMERALLLANTSCFASVIHTGKRIIYTKSKLLI